MFDSIPSLAALRTRRSSAARVVALALAAAGWLGTAETAVAANANFTVTVQPIPAGTSVGRNGLATYAAYKVDIANVIGNTTNAIRFSGSTDVSGDCGTSATACDVDAQAAALYVETIPSTACSGSGTTIQCNIGQMKAGDSTSFVLIFQAPALGDADHWASSAINFSWSLDYASGNSSGTPSSIFCNGDPCSAVASTNLITTLDGDILSGVTSYIPSLGGTFFTGDGISARSTSQAATSTTKLKIPEAENLTTAQVQQFIDAFGLTSATTTTNRTYITVPNNGALFGAFVTIELRRDASTISKGAKIANATVSYSHTAEVNNTEVTDFVPLNACPSNGVPNASEPVCVFSRTEFTKKNAPTPDDIGDWLFVIHALENGGFRF